jgi:hypothetical protein
MSYQQQNSYPHGQPYFGPHGFGPHGNFGFQPNQNNYQYSGNNNEQGFNQQQMGFPPHGNFYPPNMGNYPQPGFNQPQFQQPEPEPAHEHPLNFEGTINDKCKICLLNIGDKGGYKCKDCPIILCLDCSQKIFYGNKKKQIHQHDLLLEDRNSWTCDICKTSYMDNASFHCEQCDFDACEKCYLENNQPQQFQPPQPYPQQNNQQPYPQPPFQPPQPYPQQNNQQPYPQPPFQPPQGQYQPNQPAYAQEQGYQPQGGNYPQQDMNYNPQEYYQNQEGYQQQYQEQEIPPESDHEHPLNYVEQLNDICKLCLKQINGNAYKCNECPIVLCLNCSDKIFYGNKNKAIHQHELFLRDRHSWKCNICKKSKKDNAAFNCKQCDFDVCDDCFFQIPQQGQQGYQMQQEAYAQQYQIPQGNQQMQPAYAQSQEQDDYEAFHDHPLHYEERLNDKCKLCEQNIGGKEGYKCKDCPLILCLSCLNKIYYGAKKKSLHNHDLILQERSNWKCNICKQKKGNASFYCKECDFDACQDCYIENTNQGSYSSNQINIQNQQYQQNQQEKPIGTDVSRHEHPLYYSEKLKEKCCLCLKNLNNEKGYKCKNCKFSLCFNCSNRIFNKPQNKLLHGHDLFLMMRKNWKCNKCRKQFKNQASFYCKKCVFDSCENCYLKK